MPTFYPAEILRLENSLDKYPIGSLPNTNSYLGNEGYGMITYKTDRFGLRNHDKNGKMYTDSQMFLSLGIHLLMEHVSLMNRLSQAI